MIKKNFFTLLFLLFTLVSTYAQDIMILHNRKKEKVKVLQVNSSQIIYQSYNDQSILQDSILVIRKNEIDTINYEDGYQEVYNLNLRKERPWGIHATLNGPVRLAAVAVGVDYFINPSLAFEVGSNIISFYGGIRYHFLGNRIRYWTPYIGAFASFATFAKSVTNGLYIPVGFHYISDGGFMFSPDIGFTLFNNGQEYRSWVSIGIKLGYQFGK